MTFYPTRQIRLHGDGPEAGRVLAVGSRRDVYVARLNSTLRRVTKSEFMDAPDFDTVHYGWDGTTDDDGCARYREIAEGKCAHG